MRHHHRIALFEQALDLFAVKLLFVEAQRDGFRRERIDGGFRIKHHTHFGFSFYWLNKFAVIFWWKPK